MTQRPSQDQASREPVGSPRDALLLDEAAGLSEELLYACTLVLVKNSEGVVFVSTLDATTIDQQEFPQNYHMTLLCSAGIREELHIALKVKHDPV